MPTAPVRSFRNAAFALALLALSAIPALGQTGKLTGVVTDQQTGAPLAGVQVFLEGTGRGTLTQENGRYFIINVPVGNYTVSAQIIGYATLRKENVQVTVDITRTLDFQLPSQALAVQEIVVEAERVPLIEVKSTGSGATMVAADIQALPVQDLSGVLNLQAGFLPISDDNTDILSYNDAHRGTSPIRIRGGREGETMTLLDGIPINNVLFGSPSFDITNFAIEQLTTKTGGFTAEYGNFLSGVIDIATKEGTRDLRGALSFQTSGFAGSLGSNADDARNYDQYEGYVSGPVPGTSERLRYLLSGRQTTGAAKTLEFDDQVTTPTVTSRDELGRAPYVTDLIPGWQGIGFNSRRDLYGKLTYYLTPSAKLNVGGLYYEQQVKPFNRDFMVADRDWLAICNEQYPGEEDWCRTAFRQGQTPVHLEDMYDVWNVIAFMPYMVYNSIEKHRSMFWAKWDHTIGNSFYRVAAGRLNQDRLSCNWFSGVCLEDHIRNYTTVGAGFFVPRQTRNAPRATHVPASSGTENFFGSDTMHTTVVRADVGSQLTEHHNVSAGLFYQRHDFTLREARNIGRAFDDDDIGRYQYSAEPWDIGIYFQDKIEYDFLTVNLGFRLDRFSVPGTYFTDPRDPTNGTTAFEVCQGTARSLGITEPFTWTSPGGTVFSGISACSLAADEAGNDFLMDSARVVAFKDDFSDIEPRTEFSPRIGLAFPVTENISVFANYGRYTQNPIYHNLLARTGIGRTADIRFINPVSGDTIQPGQSMEGTPNAPDLRSLSLNNANLLPLVGNPRLRSERTTSYEVGFNAELFENYGLQVVAHSKDQTGLTGARRGGVLPNGVPINDPGETYGSTRPQYYVLVNTDFQTVRGFDIRLSRRVRNFWGFNLTYSYMQAWTNAAPPDLEIQKFYEGDVAAFREIRSEIDLPHVATGSFTFSAGQETPDFRFGELLRNSTLTLTTRLQSGFPYTPQFVSRLSATTIVDAGRADRNSGTSPAIFTVDLLARKNLRLANLNYGAFLRVSNLFDTKNCAQVYPTSGRCDDGTLSIDRTGIGAFVNGFGNGNSMIVAGASAPNTFFDRPEMFRERRSITAGLSVSF